jgi:hypothetical protein
MIGSSGKIGAHSEALGGVGQGVGEGHQSVTGTQHFLPSPSVQLTYGETGKSSAQIHVLPQFDEKRPHDLVAPNAGSSPAQR